MKLFKIATHMEGDLFEDNVFLTIGRSAGFYPICDDNPDKIYNRGWYIRLQLPFKKFMKYNNPQTFEMEQGLCQKVFYWKFRNNSPKFIKVAVWKPI